MVLLGLIITIGILLIKLVYVTMILAFIKFLYWVPVLLEMRVHSKGWSIQDPPLAYPISVEFGFIILISRSVSFP